MTVLVTGHLGYVGSVLVPLLQEAGHEVLGTDSGWAEQPDLEPVGQGVPNLQQDARALQAEDLAGG